MARKQHEKSSVEVEIVRVAYGQVGFCILGTSPLILNRISDKARRELLLPKRKTAADRAGSLKHDPISEFRSAPYTDKDDRAPTLLQHVCASFKAAMCDAALDVPGTSKAQIGRLCVVEGERVSIYGVPNMLMSVVRNSDINRTPDIRSRVIVPEWACQITVRYVKPMLNDTSITNLIVAAGISQGIGDWRIGKGKGSYGGFTLVSLDDAAFKRIVKSGGRNVQQAAMNTPIFYDDETEELYLWSVEEVKRRGTERNGESTPKNRVAKQLGTAK